MVDSNQGLTSEGNTKVKPLLASKAKYSITDLALKSITNEEGVVVRRRDADNNPDTLNTGTHAETLATFIRRCQTPLTIGVQGEWGSGKTSLLNMIREDLHEETVKLSDYTKNARDEGKGKEVFHTIWINTWEHSLLNSAENTLISILAELIEKMTEPDKSFELKQKAKGLVNQLAKGGIRAAATVALGGKGMEIADDLMGGGGSSNTVRELNITLRDTIHRIVNQKDNNFSKFIIFVDDLDRMTPSHAVAVLELLKNIFTLPECVFVVAIDYQVVVKGLEVKFGKHTVENDWEYRAFFDKVIQVPFMMPMASYSIQDYMGSLFGPDGVGIFTATEIKGEVARELATIVGLTVGSNPRSLKRLANSLALILLTIQKQNQAVSNELILKRLLVALVCLQISFPRVYEVLLREPQFWEWDKDFSDKITSGPHDDNADLKLKLAVLEEAGNEDFDEDWEKALYRIVYLKKWQIGKVSQTSKLLTQVKDILKEGAVSEDLELEFMTTTLRATAVTSVASTEEGVFAKGDEDDAAGSDKADKRKYWSRIRHKAAETGTAFNEVPGSYSSPKLTRSPKDPFLGDYVQFSATFSSKGLLKVIPQAHRSSEETSQLFSAFMENKKKLQDVSSAKVHSTNLAPETKHIEIIFGQPASDGGLLVTDGKTMYKQGDNVQDAVCTWLCDVLPGLEIALKEILIDWENGKYEQNSSSLVSEQTTGGDVQGVAKSSMATEANPTV